MLVPLLMALAGSASATPPPAGPAAEALKAGDCDLCHAVPGSGHADQLSSCHGCHVWIKSVAADPAKRAKAMQVFPLWERYERHVQTYLTVPSLTAGMARLDPEWIAAWLADPHDVRPGLPEGMPRFALTDVQRRAIADYAASVQAPTPTTPEPDAAHVELGGALFISKGCVACHTMGDRHAGPGNPLAPDLAYTRARMSPDRAAAWIADPKSVSEAATMPTPELRADEVIQLRDYVFLAPLQPQAPPALGPPPIPTSAPVTYADVEERVFGKICVHCHMDPTQNDGRAGPGNAGGFGWAATGVELQTYEGVTAHLDAIQAALLRRRDEARRDTLSPGQAPATISRPEKPGMPLGLPPLSDEDLALVLGWIAQGAPR